MRYTMTKAADYLDLDISILRHATKNRLIAHTRPTPRRTMFEQEDLDNFKSSWVRIQVVPKKTPATTTT
jgi:hypothetical protein